MSSPLVFSVPARAAIAGNPSDGHGGAVVATVVPSLAATVSATPSERFGFSPNTERFDSSEQLMNWLDASKQTGDQPLMQAAVAAMARRFDADLDAHEFEFSTNIPRSLGLAGSSAIVIATMRTVLAAHRATGWVQPLVDSPELLASVALEAERDILGIAAGLQDRVVQTIGGTVAMEFGSDHMRTSHGLDIGSYRPVGPLPGGMFVAYRVGTAGDSGLVHSAADVSGVGFQQAMARAADAGRAATDALDRSDTAALGRAMDATFDQRALVYPLDPAHVEMIDVARAAGAAVNYAGSGGSVAVLAPDGRAASALHDIGCTIIEL